MKLTWVIAALVALTGCAGNVYYVDSRFTPAEQTMIQAAAELWSDVGAEPLDFVWRQKTTYVDDARNQIIRATDREARQLHSDFEDDAIRGITRLHVGLTSSRTIIICVDRIEPNLFSGIVAHEIGHVHIGDVHAQDPSAVMYTTAGGDVLTAADKHLFLLSRMP